MPRNLQHFSLIKLKKRQSLKKFLKKAKRPMRAAPPGTEREENIVLSPGLESVAVASAAKPSIGSACEQMLMLSLQKDHRWV